MIGSKLPKDRLFWLAAATVLLIMPVLLGGAWAAQIAQNERVAAARAAVSVSRERHKEITRLMLLLAQAESSERGYLLSGDPELRRGHEAIVAQIPAATAKLETLYRQDPEQLRRIAEIRRLTVANLAGMQEILALRDQRGAAVAAVASANGPREPLKKRLYTALTDVRNAEELELAQRLEHTDRRLAIAQTATHVDFLLLALAILASGGMAFRFTYLRSNMILRIRAEADRRKAIFDSAMDAIVTINPSGGIETVNRAAGEMFGYAPDTLLGRDISVLVPLAPDGEGLFLDRLRSQQTIRDRSVCELEGRRNDGTTIPLDINLGEMPQPDGVRIVAVMRDCTERRRAEQAKDEFISTVSHELRTPLTSIAGSLGLLNAGAAGAMPDRATRLVSIAESNSRRLVRLINELLDIEKIQAGKLVLDLHNLDLTELVQRAVEGVSGLTEEFKISFAFDADPQPIPVSGDADRLVQVVTNLLSNAAKFSPRDGRVEVTVAKVDGRARIAVRDHGPGIPVEFRDRIFGKFAQADSSDTRQKGGTGLGLAISREIVERHGGRIWFDSTPGEGATFFVELPITRTAPPAPANGKPRVLLCDDDDGVAKLLSAALVDSGFDVHRTANLADTEAALREIDSYEALLLDLRLPDGDGLDLLRRLRRRPATRGLPVIVISGDPRHEEAGSLDVVDFIEKPIEMDRLRAALRNVTETGEEPPIVLHIDDDPDLRHLVVEAFAGRCRLMSADSLTAARELLKVVKPQLVIIDLGLPDGSGLDLLPELKDARGRPLPVVIFSAQSVEPGAVTDAVQAVLTKSRTSLGELASMVRLLARQRKIEEAKA